MKSNICLLTAVLFAALPLRAEKILLVAGGAKDAVGIPATEAQALRTRGDQYRRYQQTTNAFFPWMPRT